MSSTSTVTTTSTSITSSIYSYVTRWLAARRTCRSLSILGTKGPKIPVTWILLAFAIWACQLGWKHRRKRQHRKNLQMYYSLFDGGYLRFGFDIGGTLCKVVYYEPDVVHPSHQSMKEKIDHFLAGTLAQPRSSQSVKYNNTMAYNSSFYQNATYDERRYFHCPQIKGTLHFIKFQTSMMAQFIHMVKMNDFNPASRELLLNSSPSLNYLANTPIEILSPSLLPSSAVSSSSSGLSTIAISAASPTLNSPNSPISDPVSRTSSSPDPSSPSPTVLSPTKPSVPSTDSEEGQSFNSNEAIAPAPFVCATGGGAYKFYELFTEELHVDLHKSDELEALVKGIDLMVHTVPDECYYLSSYLFKSPIERTSHPPISYPYLVVNIGSGVSILKVSGPNAFVRVGGTSLGGGTFYGLCRALTGVKTFQEAIQLAEEGHSVNADLLVGDIYGGDYVQLGLSAENVAASFGKCVRGDTLQNVSRADLAKAALVMITNNIGSLANLYAHQVLHVPQIIFVGNFLTHNDMAKRGLAFATDYWSHGTARALFLRHEGYFGAVGSLLYPRS